LTTVNTIGDSFSLANESNVVDLGQATVFLNVSCLREPFMCVLVVQPYRYDQFPTLSSTFPQLFLTTT